MSAEQSTENNTSGKFNFSPSSSLTADEMGALRFFPISVSESEAAGINSGRPAFSTQGDRIFYLYHTMAEPATDGVGRWVINDVLGVSDNAIAYIDTWAVLPHLVREVNDIGHNQWMLSSGGSWGPDASLSTFCIYDEKINIPLDSTVYFDSSDISIPISGFYLETVSDKELTKYDGPLYSQVKAVSSDVQLYLYKNGGKWIIGDISNIGSESGVAFVDDDAIVANQIK
eukprot:gene15957-33586_t